MATLLSGVPVAQALSQEIKQNCRVLRAHGINPTFSIVRVGARPDDLSYERGVSKRAEKLDVCVRKFTLPEDVSEEQLIATLEQINADDAIHGCLLFRPLPPSLDTQKISRVLSAEKDVDAITTASMGGLLTNVRVGFAPCTATACLKLLHYYQIPLQGKRIVVVGKSVTVGLPTALLMMNEDATVSVCHILTRTEDTRDMCRNADIIISAAGCANLIRADYVHSGQVVVDVGINIDPDGKICGDVAFSEVEPIVKAITPVPGGVGAVTSTVLIGHTVEAAMRTLNCRGKGVSGPRTVGPSKAL